MSRVTNYYVVCGYTDLRRGIEGLASIVMLRIDQPKAIRKGKKKDLF